MRSSFAALTTVQKEDRRAADCASIGASLEREKVRRRTSRPAVGRDGSSRAPLRLDSNSTRFPSENQDVTAVGGAGRELREPAPVRSKTAHLPVPATLRV